MTTIRGLVFDFDGLILDTETPLYRSWIAIYAEVGLEVSASTWAGLLGAAADPPEAYDLLERHLGHPIDRDALHRRRMTHEMELLRYESILPGVLETLEAARSRHLRTAIASSSDRAWVTGHIGRLGLRPFFDVIVCAEDVEHTKPEPDLYLLAAERLEIEPRHAVAFEDSLHGLRAARRAGMLCVAVPNRITRGLPFDEADLILESLLDVPLGELLARLERRTTSRDSEVETA